MLSYLCMYEEMARFCFQISSHDLLLLPDLHTENERAPIDFKNRPFIDNSTILQCPQRFWR
jgi:hypothetical protein